MDESAERVFRQMEQHNQIREAHKRERDRIGAAGRIALDGVLALIHELTAKGDISKAHAENVVRFMLDRSLEEGDSAANAAIGAKLDAIISTPDGAVG